MYIFIKAIQIVSNKKSLTKMSFTAWKHKERNRHRDRDRKMHLVNFRGLRESCKNSVTNNSFNDSK